MYKVGVNLKESGKGYMGGFLERKREGRNAISKIKKKLNLLLTNQENRKSKLEAQMESVWGEELVPDSEQVHSHCTLTREKHGLTAWITLVFATIPFTELLVTTSQHYQHEG